jgi:hypothetical protein
MGYCVLSIFYNSREDACKVGYMLRCCEAENRTAFRSESRETPDTSLYVSDPTTKDIYFLNLFNLGEYTSTSDLAQGFLFLFEISFRRALQHACHHIFVTRFLLFLLRSLCGCGLNHSHRFFRYSFNIHGCRLLRLLGYCFRDCFRSSFRCRYGDELRLLLLACPTFGATIFKGTASL